MMRVCRIFPFTATAPRVALVAALWAAGCSPTLNWRTVRHEAAPVQALLPCKAEHTTREVALRGPQRPTVALHMLNCQVAGRTFAVAAVRLPDHGRDGDQPAAWIDHWLRASWATLQLRPGPDAAPPAWTTVPCRVRDARWMRCWRGPGRAPDGKPIEAELHWASDGRWLAQIALYRPGLPADAHETYFAGLALH